jgi:hypothetical protein
MRGPVAPFLLTLAAVLSAPGALHAATHPACPVGKFNVPGPPLLGFGADDSDSVTLTTGAGGVYAGTATGCQPVLARRYKGTRKWTKLVVQWDGCGIYTGRIQLNAKIDAATCNSMTAYFRYRDPSGHRVKRGFVATRSLDGCDDGGLDTFAVIQQRIFGARGCNVATCHGSFGQGGLDLQPTAAHTTLVGVPATNAAAAAAGKLRVLPGNAAGSFLSQKVRGTLGPGEGSQMPLVGGALSALETGLIDAWIDAGAPATGRVPDAPCLPAFEYVPTQRPAAPPGGYQIELDGPTLQPGQEQEGCLWIPTPNPTDFAAGQWEFHLNPGTHHFAIFEYNRGGAPPLGQWTANDFGCFSGAQFGNTISGSPQAPYFVATYPSGVARVLRAGRYLGLNAHYRNYWQVPIQIKVWINVWPYDGSPSLLAQTVFDVDDMFNISVAPFTQKVQPGRFNNNTGMPINVYVLSGHMHQRGLRFTARTSDGTKVYENFDFAHPLQRYFNPPLVIAPGDWIDYECLHDNGVTRPVRRNGAGDPTTLFFGVTTEDEMCTLNGEYYTN